MTRFFALPVMATVLSLVGVRMLAVPAPVPAVPAAAAAQEPEMAPSPIVTPQDLWEPAAPPTPPPPPPPPPAPRPEPVIIVLEPLPAPPAPQIEITNQPTVAPQVTIINAQVTNVYPVVEAAAPATQEVVDQPVAIGVGLPLCAAHRRPGCCLPKPPALQQDPFFKKTPFLPPTPRRARFEP
jgi:hypothetical protein